MQNPTDYAVQNTCVSGPFIGVSLLEVSMDFATLSVVGRMLHNNYSPVLFAWAETHCRLLDQLWNIDCLTLSQHCCNHYAVDGISIAFACNS